MIVSPKPPPPATCPTPLPPGRRILFLLAVLFLAYACRKPPKEIILLASEMVEVGVRPSALGDPSSTEWKVRHAGHDWSIRTRIPALSQTKSFETPEVRAILERNFNWSPPYLFIREVNANREASRAVVDHVFRCTNGAVQRLGTLAAPAGPPGSQRENGRFRDVYDRLEFSPLAAPQRGPTFPILVKDVYGRFRVDTEATWLLSQTRFEERFQAIQSHIPPHSTNAPSPQHPPAAPDRIARADALFCLALARYCDRPREFEKALAAARTFVQPLQDLLDEIDTVVPGELAASRDEVLRSNPALVNVFKESAEDPDEAPFPALPSEEPAPGTLPILPSSTPPGLKPD